MRHLFLSIMLSCCAVFSTAQQLDSTFYLNDVVVTGTRTPKLLKDTPIQTRLITAADIEKVDATNVVDLMQQELPGVEFSYAMNQQLHINFNGFGGQSILFLVDGERLAGETLDDIDFTRLNMANVERIEIVKGAASALYGSNAGGGVINIITKEETKPWTLNYNAHLSHRNNRQNITWGTKGKRVRNMLNLNANLNDSYHLSNASNPTTLVVNTVYGDSCWSLKDQLTYIPSDQLKLIGRIGFFEREVTRTIDAPDMYRNLTSGLRAQWELSPNDQFDFSYAFDQYDKAIRYKLFHRTIRQYSNSQNTIRGTYHHSFKRGDILTTGTDVMHGYLMNKNLEGSSYHQNVIDAFLQYDWLITPQWEMVGALRYDHFSDSKNSRITPKLSARYQPQKNLNLRFGYGMGFRAPSLKEKYYNFDMAGIWIVNGNPDLKAEVSHNFNVSADYTKGHYNITASAYYNDVENKLATGIPHYIQTESMQLYLDYVNLENYSVYGGDVTVQARWDNGFSTRLSYAYTNERIPHDKDGNNVNNQYIPARHHSITARADWDKQFTRRYGLRLSLNGRFLSSVKNKTYVNYYDITEGTNTVKYPAYTLWKLSATQRFGTAFKLTLAADNLLNYKPKYYYFNSPMTEGFTMMMTASLDIDRLF